MWCLQLANRRQVNAGTGTARSAQPLRRLICDLGVAGGGGLPGCKVRGNDWLSLNLRRIETGRPAVKLVGLVTSAWHIRLSSARRVRIVKNNNRRHCRFTTIDVGSVFGGIVRLQLERQGDRLGALKQIAAIRRLPQRRVRTRRCESVRSVHDTCILYQCYLNLAS